MKGTWNLDPIYRGFEDPAFGADLEKLKDMASRYMDFAAGLEGMDPLTGLREGIVWEEELTALARKLATYAQLRQSVDTRDTACGSFLGQVMQIVSGTAGAGTAWQEWAVKQENLMDLVRKDELLKAYTFRFENLQQESRHLLGGLGEEISARMQLSGGNAWSELQGYLTSTVAVDYNGSTTNLSAIRNLAYNPDPAVRKAAYEAELACYPRIRDSVAFALNSIKLETLTDCQLRKYPSPLDRTLAQSCMKRETLDAMMTAIEEYLPTFRQYLKAKARALGYTNGLPWYELFAPMGNSGRKYTIAQTGDLLVELFSSFDGELADMVRTAFDNQWIDFYPRSGKTGGAFCETVDCIGESRILTNFDGMFTDVVTLAHECAS